MSDTTIGINEGTTFAWTCAYGDPPSRLRRRELLRHAIFATALAAFVTGVAGFVSYEPEARYAKAQETRPAL